MTRPNNNLSAAKTHCFDYLDRNAKAIACLNDNIFYFAELGMQEFETAKLMTALLEDAGFKVERGICGFPTGFCATFGSGHPVIAMHTEYDSNPDNSQASGVAEQTRDRRGRARPLRRPQCQRCRADRQRARGQSRDGKIRPQRHAQGFRRAGRRATSQPPLFRARRLVRRRRSSPFTIISPAISASATA